MFFYLQINNLFQLLITVCADTNLAWMVMGQIFSALVFTFVNKHWTATQTNITYS
jgi:hypothetical protein